MASFQKPYGNISILSSVFRSVEKRTSRHFLPILGVLLTCLSASPVSAALSTENPELQNRSVEAQTLLSEKKWPEAVIALRSVLKSRPDSYETALDLAKALVYSGRREEALGILVQAADRARGSYQTMLIRRVNVLSRLFLTSENLKVYQDGLDLLKAGKYGAAHDFFEKIIAKEPDNVEALIRIAQCDVIEGGFDSAAEHLRIARRLNPFEPEIRLWLGRALHQRGETPEALVELKIARGKLHKSELSAVWLAEALSSAGQKPVSLQVLEADVREAPFHLASLITLARLRMQNATRDQASFWDARKELQLALSRTEEYSKHSFESELGVDLRQNTQLKHEIQALLQQIDARIAGTSIEE